MTGPLEGVRVVAFEQAIALPFGSMILSEMGADVIKIERPGSGDVVRGWDDVVKGLSSGFVSFNVGKRDLAVDVAHPDGKQVVLDLAQRADVFLENFSPGVTARLGLGHKDLMKANDRLIYCSLSGYGQDGPFRDVKAFDLLIQGESGLLFTNGNEGAPAKVGMPITDLIGGAHVAFGILGALLKRESTGQGSYLDVALLESTLFWLGYFPHYQWHGVPQPPLRGMRHQFICPYGPFRAADGRFVNVAVASQPHWIAFCEQVLERPDLIKDPRFETLLSRNKNNVALDGLIEDSFEQHPHGYWIEKLERARLPYGLVREMSEVVDHPQLVHRRSIVEADSPVGTIPAVRMPGSDRNDRRIPELGQDSVDILAELGYGDSRIQHLLEAGVISGPSE
ncbi:MAG TPA: CaiB/BaiF CoA-transferase family protein [Actinomycetota bacterium]|nr:CaiB/BaiF CoA-transferase family protein [Actinomycetota bacterium]